MSHSKHALRTLGLCLLAALCLMAFAAASAPATTGWLESGSFITSTTKIHAAIHPLAIGVKHVKLDATIGISTLVEKLCETLATEDGLIFPGGGATGTVTLKFTNCDTFINGILAPACKPVEPIVAKTRFTAILHFNDDKKTYILFEPQEFFKPFATITLKEECALGEKVPITGAVVAECLNSKLEKNTASTDYCLESTVHHYIQEAPHNLFAPDELLYGSKRMLLLGIADVLLTNAANTWGVHI
jgi:hypothetical protein